jgi:hypothetical protein
LGNTWYDSLQAKLVQRLSRGLTAQVSYTWQKELTNGANSDTSYLTPNPPLINDVFNRAQQKQISSFGRPQVLVVSFNYTTPGLNSDSTGMKIISAVAKDWTFGGALRYQSGEVIRVPASNNGLFNQLARTDNPAIWGGANTFWNRVPGQPFLLKDPNCHCIDPTKDLILNPAAWQDAPAGQFGTSAPYYNDFRWQRQPSESLSVGRNFRLAGENKVMLNVRAEFQNVFNRLFLSSPSAVNPAAPVTRNTLQELTGGYGWVNSFAGAGARPRSGQIVARVTF